MAQCSEFGRVRMTATGIDPDGNLFAIFCHGDNSRCLAGSLEGNEFRPLAFWGPIVLTDAEKEKLNNRRAERDDLQ